MVALLSAAIATLAFHNYRQALTNDRLATELTAQVTAIAPLIEGRLDSDDAPGAARLLRSFAGLHYVTCVDLLRGDLLEASFPPPGCERVQARGSDRDIAIMTGSGARLLFRARVDDDLLMAPVQMETFFVASLMIILSAVIFIVLSLSFRRMVLNPLEALRAAMQASTPSNPVRASLLHDDEIGAIVKAYNSLVAAARLFFRRLDRSQNQLAESERRFRELAEVSGDWFFEMDSDLRLSFISDRFYEITGLTPDEVIGRTRQEIATTTNLQGEFDQHVARSRSVRDWPPLISRRGSREAGLDTSGATPRMTSSAASQPARQAVAPRRQ